MGPCSDCEQQPERDCLVGSSMVLSRSKIKAVDICLGSSVVECSRGNRETLGSSPGRATFFFHPCDMCNSDLVLML